MKRSTACVSAQHILNLRVLHPDGWTAEQVRAAVFDLDEDDLPWEEGPLGRHQVVSVQLGVDDGDGEHAPIALGFTTGDGVAEFEASLIREQSAEGVGVVTQAVVRNEVDAGLERMVATLTRENKNLRAELLKAAACLTGTMDRIVVGKLAAVAGISDGGWADAGATLEALEVARTLPWAELGCEAAFLAGVVRSQRGRVAELERRVEDLTLAYRDAKGRGDVEAQARRVLQAQVAELEAQLRIAEGALAEAEDPDAGPLCVPAGDDCDDEAEPGIESEAQWTRCVDVDEGSATPTPLNPATNCWECPRCGASWSTYNTVCYCASQVVAVEVNVGDVVGGS